MNDAAGRQKQEGGAKSDATFMQQLQEKKRCSGDHCYTRQHQYILLILLCVNVSHLDDEEECRGRIKGPVIKSDDGGAT